MKNNLIVLLAFYALTASSQTKLQKLKSDSVLIEKLSFNNGKIKLNMPLKVFKKNYPNLKFVKFKVEDDEAEDGYYYEDRYYLSEKNYCWIEKIINENTAKILKVQAEQSALYADGCGVMVGDSLQMLKNCYPNSYKRDLLKYEKWDIKSRKSDNIQILFVKIVYANYKDNPLSLMYWCDILTQKIIKIETYYEE